jgi:hypothetical protein
MAISAARFIGSLLPSVDARTTGMLMRFMPPPIVVANGDADPASAGEPPPDAQNPRLWQQMLLPDA